MIKCVVIWRTDQQVDEKIRGILAGFHKKQQNSCWSAVSSSASWSDGVNGTPQLQRATGVAGLLALVALWQSALNDDGRPVRLTFHTISLSYDGGQWQAGTNVRLSEVCIGFVERQQIIKIGVILTNTWSIFGIYLYFSLWLSESVGPQATVGSLSLSLCMTGLMWF